MVSRPVPEFRKIGEVIGSKCKILKVIDSVAQAAGDGIATVEWLLPKGEVKYRLMLKHLLFPVTIRHGELVKVSQKCWRNSVFVGHE